MLSSSFSGLSLQSRRPCASVQQLQASQLPDRCRGAGPLAIEAAHKKGGGSTKNGRDSNAQRRGVKVYGGQPVKAGGIIIRQVGSTVHAGDGVGTGKDYTLFALKEGVVVFQKNKYIKKVNVVDFKDYETPEGCRVKEGSRKMRRKQQYKSRKQSVIGAAAVASP